MNRLYACLQMVVVVPCSGTYSRHVKVQHYVGKGGFIYLYMFQPGVAYPTLVAHGLGRLRFALSVQLEHAWAHVEAHVSHMGFAMDINV